MMKIKQLFFSLLFIGTSTFAQEVDYYFEQFTNTYKNIEDPISLSNNIIWDDPEYQLQIDMDFDLLGATLTEINFGPGLGGDLYNGDMSYSLFPITADIADRAYNDYFDNEDEPGGLSPISYKVIGEEGSQILKIEWNNVGFYEDESNSYYMNFQLWLYEGSDMIEVHYGLSNVPDNFFNSEENICGFFAVDFTTEIGSGFTLEEESGNYVFGFNYLDADWEGNFFTSVPENGTVFRFYPEYAVGMDEIESVIKMHPNPATDVLYLENDEQVLTKYQIVSLDGRILKTGTSSEQKIQVDISDLNTGMYFVRGTKNGAHFTKTISKI